VKMKVLEAISPIADTIEMPTSGFRRYDEQDDDPIQTRVKQHYYLQHQFQTVDFVKSRHEKWLNFTHARLTIFECLDLLNEFVDQSDPDLDDANIIHAFQTAESLRQAVPDKPWMHLTGLIHDLGKVMSIWGEAQWAVTGDTYPVGCYPVESIVYGQKSFNGNPDIEDERYNTKLGMYKEGCGIENLTMTWSHDEYMYQVLKNDKNCTLPDESLYSIRYHSFYPYHNCSEYMYFQNERDKEMRKYIDELNSCDLYSKHDEHHDIEALKPYYQTLIDKYIPGVLSW